MVDQKNKPKTAQALDTVESIVNHMVDGGDSYIDKESKRLFVRVSSLSTFADKAKELGISVKVLGDLSDEFVSVGFRALIKLDDFSEHFEAADSDFITMSHECETD